MAQRSRQGRRRSQFRRGGGGGRASSLGSGDLATKRDLQVSGGYVNNAGAVTGITGWNGGPITLTPGLQAAYQAVVLPQAATAAGAPPSIGECEIVDVEGSIFLSTPSAAGLYFIGFGIYISKYDSRTGTWGIRYPSTTSSDAARDDWLALRAICVTLPLPANVTDPMMIELKLQLPHQISLGGGEALHVCVDNNATSVGSFQMWSFFRTRIADVT